METNDRGREKNERTKADETHAPAAAPEAADDFGGDGSGFADGGRDIPADPRLRKEADRRAGMERTARLLRPMDIQLFHEEGIDSR